MEKHVTVTKAEALPGSLNYDALRLAGIAYAQQLSGRIWTDYNVHDPGVTLLEYLCFALTDLSYRANFPVKDLLYADDENGHPTVANAFFPAHEILPTTPVTPTDYRRMIIDRINDVRNAWVDPIVNHPHGYQGLFRVRLQLADQIDRMLSPQAVEAQVRDLLMAHRNLCEDFTEIVILANEPIRFAATIDIEPDAYGEVVLATILHTIEELLNPGVRYYTREELQGMGLTPDDIFDGPEPEQGFILPWELRPLPRSTHVSLLRESISRVAGVKMVNDLVVWKNGQRVREDEIIPSPDTALSLDISMLDGTGQPGEIRLLRNGVPVRTNPRQTRQFHNDLAAKVKKGFQLKLDLRDAPAASTRKMDDLAAYHSFQHLLPTVYGLGPFGPPPTATREHRAQVRQLKGYLLFFEQFLANYLAQLANVRNLFSIAPEHDHRSPSYFHQFPTDIPDVAELLRSDEKDQPTPADIDAAMAGFADPHRTADERRNRFLDHLLARFGEVYSGDFLKILNQETRDELTHLLLVGKAAYLRAYPELSRNRSKAFDYSIAAWENENVAGLKKRTALLLNLHRPADPTAGDFVKYHNRSLVDFAALADLPGAGEATNAEEHLVLPYSFAELLLHGTRPGNYRIMPTEAGDFQLRFRIDKAGEKEAEGAAAGARLMTGSKESLERTRDALIRRFNRINDQSEGFFFLENILLRPRSSGGTLLVLELPLPANLGGGSLVLRSPAYTSEADLQELSNEFLVLATRPANWTLLETASGHCIVLARNQHPLLMSLPIAEDRSIGRGAARAEQQLTFLIERCRYYRDNDPPALLDRFRPVGERLAGHRLSADFYSLRLSVIAPDWPASFQQKDFQQLFQRVIAEHVPAHLTVDYYWLPPGKMREFEGLFKNWLAALRLADEAAHNKYSLAISQLLTGNGNPGPAATPSSTGPLPREVLQRLLQRFGYDFFLSPRDFSIFAGMDAASIRTLKLASIDSWQALHRTPAGKLRSIFVANDEPEKTEEEVRSWRHQAMLALEGRWEDLLRFQEKTLRGQPADPPRRPSTKLERKRKSIAKDPAGLLDRLEAWIQRQPSRSALPYFLLDFLCQATSYRLIVPQDDFLLIPGLDDTTAAWLRTRGIRDFEQLNATSAEGWEELRDQLPPQLSLPEYQLIKSLSDLAVAERWEELLAQQADLPTPRPLESRIVHHLQTLRTEVDPGTLHKRLLTDLRAYRSRGGTFSFSGDALRILLAEPTDGIVFPANNLELLEGIGPKTAQAMRDAGIHTFQDLAAESALSLHEKLTAHNLIITSDQVIFWLAQADLAHRHQWGAVEELQRRRDGKSPGPTAPATPLQTRVETWLEANSLPPDPNYGT
ncbi:helix-hairpin-helix domain-containing protein [Neolewinella lacunae]|uniref:DUF4332 domain-containing protein n=1 Tax=Neolewinella lacunae TaxID=1517758 RepID=A0A923PRY8_9BACT|nr:helix-hairpin-helix domain-containing protein [Neolewinella lacunae]MBC6996661.1 hypothetical protein [Neolewinella lacunae]MDN3634774.1 helix-hairpin-helix domain-containing protein [Neolewinella lacunae]